MYDTQYITIRLLYYTCTVSAAEYDQFTYFIYSYSSLSVSPTHFSPTQSPIQPRHIQRSFHEYTVAEETNGYEEKLSMSDINQQHGITSGISRQQLINRYVYIVMYCE